MRYFIALFLLLIAMPVRAEVFVWTDSKYDITVAFPDNWMRQTQTPDDLRLYVLAPQGQDHAACRVFANKDGRFLYVPAKAQHKVAAFVQDTKAAQQFLDGRLEYDDVRLVGYQNIGGLGKGAATVAVAQYIKDWNGQKIQMQSIQFGGYMNGLETIFHCEAMQQAFGRWHPVFMNMVKSFDFPAQYASHKQGYYRDFTADGYVFFPAGFRQGIKKD
ncbi:MAG: hypothetical protein COB76_05840 [Alphaproteobacteria bacterium]|nr:MAG: hypothetical protein COB76_05840 [Alphaproteobacteria bacterium]